MSERAVITPQYHGIFSNTFSWNEQALKEIAEAADLRTNITIRNGSNLNVGRHLSIRERLNPKRLYDPDWMLVHDERGTLDISLRFDAKGSKAEIVIHDQIVWGMVTNRQPDAKKVPVETTHEIERLSKLGIAHILHFEKTISTQYALNSLLRLTTASFEDAERKINTTIPKLGCQVLGNAVWYSFLAGVGAYGALNGEIPVLGSYGTFVVGSLGVVMSVAAARKAMHGTVEDAVFIYSGLKALDERIKNSPHPYCASLGDFNPLKHLGHWNLGSKILNSASTHLLIPDEHT